MIKNGSRLSGDIRRDQIVEAALRIIANRGVKSLTTAAIAEEVGISEANLYRHFNSKDEILQGTVEKIGEGLLPALFTVLEFVSITRLSIVIMGDGFPLLLLMTAFNLARSSEKSNGFAM